MSQRKAIIEPNHPVSIRRQAELLEVPRSSLYYTPEGESDENLQLMEQMDRLFTGDPTLGVLGMQDELTELGLCYNVKRIRRLVREMGLEPIYPRKNLSRRGQAKYIHPYLLKGFPIERPNQVWAIDISYIPMAKGFMYLTAIIDVYSRYIVGWQIANTLDKQTQTELLKQAIRQYGLPEIINSDQGSQYTCGHWVETLTEYKIRISMDGKGRATDNAFIERWFRTIKQKYIYLHPAENGLELYQGIDTFVKKYNRRRHQGIDRRKPIDLYRHAA